MWWDWRDAWPLWYSSDCNIYRIIHTYWLPNVCNSLNDLSSNSRSSETTWFDRERRLGCPKKHLLELVYIDSFTVYELQQLVGLRSRFLYLSCVYCVYCVPQGWPNRNFVTTISSVVIKWLAYRRWKNFGDKSGCFDTSVCVTDIQTHDRAWYISITVTLHIHLRMRMCDKSYRISATVGLHANKMHSQFVLLGVSHGLTMPLKLSSRCDYISQDPLFFRFLVWALLQSVAQ